MKLILLLFVLLPSPVFAQAIGANVLKLKPTTLPSVCALGDFRLDTSSSTPQWCNGSNVWGVFGTSSVDSNHNLWIDSPQASTLTSGSYNAIANYLTNHSAFPITTGAQNACFGVEACIDLTTGQQNAAVGFGAGANLTSGGNNTTLGWDSGQALSGQNGHTLVGAAAGINLNDASVNYDTCIGQSCLYHATSSGKNACAGFECLSAITTATNDNGYNSSLGYLAGGTTMAAGADLNIMIGAGTDGSAAGAQNQMVLGNFMTPGGNNQGVIGDNSMMYYIAGGTRGTEGSPGSATPAARLEIGAGSSTVPAMIIDNATKTTSPVNNAFENDGSNLWYTTSTGTRSQLTLGNGPTASYAWGYIAGGNAESWTTNSASYTDMTNSGGNALTLPPGSSSGITLSAPASNKLGFVFTPASSSAIYWISVNLNTEASSGHILSAQLTDGTTAIGSASTFNNTGSIGITLPITGIYAPGTTSPVTIKVQGADSTGGGAVIGIQNGIENRADFRIFRIF